MLHCLHIDNIILIEQATVPFSSGWNVLTGETGSGKSAVTEALALALGARADSRLIRRGAERGAVEAEFSLPQKCGPLTELLEEAGIACEAEEPLIIRRELSLSGKGRVFINNRLAQLSLLKKIGDRLAEIVGQHATHDLKNSDTHRELLDLFGEIDTAPYREAWREQLRLEKKLETLAKSEAERQREIDRLIAELEELEQAAVKEGEEEELFREYSLLANAEERAQQAAALLSTLSLPELKKGEKALAALAENDEALKETAASYSSAVLELQEAEYTLERYLGSIEQNPARQQELDGRLALVARLKRKYGEDLARYIRDASDKLACLEDADHKIETVEKALEKAKTETDKFSKTLSKKRAEAAKRLEKGLCSELMTLNMAKALFTVSLEKKARDETGDDKVEFFLAPNVGENAVPLQSAASGGELARVMLALKTLLAAKEGVPVLIFDEIDANIGGETAAVVGKKLKEIGKSRQVLSITHFPQTALQADHHIRIAKEEAGGRTLTLVALLDDATREEELERMRGGALLKS